MQSPPHILQAHLHTQQGRCDKVIIRLPLDSVCTFLPIAIRLDSWNTLANGLVCIKLCASDPTVWARSHGLAR